MNQGHGAHVLKGEGRLTDELLREKLQRASGPITFGKKRARRRDAQIIIHGLR